MTTANLAAREQELVELEAEFWQALRDHDVDTATELTDFPCIVAGAQGVSSIDEATFVAMMEDAPYTLDDFELGKDTMVRFVSDDVAIVAYKAMEKVTIDGEPVELEVADSSTWVRRDGRWKCAQHSEAILGDPFGRDRRHA